MRLSLGFARYRRANEPIPVYRGADMRDFRSGSGAPLWRRPRHVRFGPYYNLSLTMLLVSTDVMSPSHLATYRGI